MTDAETTDTWVLVGTRATLQRARVLVVPGPYGDVCVFWNDGDPVALADRCIHRDRQLSRGMVFQGRIVCPGHQWGFDLQTGFCAERDRTQPNFAVRVDGEDVFVDPATVANADELTETDHPQLVADAELESEETAR